MAFELSSAEEGMEDRVRAAYLTALKDDDLNEAGKDGGGHQFSKVLCKMFFFKKKPSIFFPQSEEK